MELAETVTFAGAGVDRAAERRADADALRSDAGARAILMWRGKPLLAGDALQQVPLDHPVMRDAGPDPVFLGQVAGAPLFAADLSGWAPEGLDDSTLGQFHDPSQQVHPALPDAVFAELRAVMTRLSPSDAELAATAKAIIGWHATHRFCAGCGAESQSAMAGWQRNCASCGTKHFPRTDPVVIMLVTRGNNVLLGRSHGWPAGMYSLLAGFVEPGETIEAAVRREVFEEAGVRIGRVGYLASQPWPFPASLMIGCKAEALDEAITIDPAEIDDAIWVSREELARAFAGEHPQLLPARKGAIAQFLLQGWLADRLD